MGRRTKKQKIKTTQRLTKIEYQLPPDSLVKGEKNKNSKSPKIKTSKAKSSINTEEQGSNEKFKKDVSLSLLFAVFILALEVVIYFV